MGCKRPGLTCGPCVLRACSGIIMVLLTVPLVRSKARVDKLAEVQNLNLWGQDLTDVSVLDQLPCVEVLSLSVNCIPTLVHFVVGGRWHAPPRTPPGGARRQPVPGTSRQQRTRPCGAVVPTLASLARLQPLPAPRRPMNAGPPDALQLPPCPDTSPRLHCRPAAS